MKSSQKPFVHGTSGDVSQIHHFHHVWLVQGLSKPVNQSIQAALPDNKKHLFDPSRTNFWFEGPYKELRRLEQTNNMKCPVFVPWEIPEGYTGQEVDEDIAAVGQDHGIEFVAVSPEIMSHLRSFDNFYTKPYSHGIEDISSDYTPEEFESLKAFSDIMAKAVARFVDEHNMESEKTVINVQNKYMIGVPKSLREESATENAVITYFSHIPIIATSNPKAFELVHQDVKQYYADTLSACDQVNIHSSAQVDELEFFVEKYAAAENLQTDFGTVFLGIDHNKWVDIIRSEKAWDVAKDVLEKLGGTRQAATMYGRLDVFKGLDVVPQIIDQLLENFPEHQDQFTFVNVYGRVNQKSSSTEDPFTRKLNQVDVELTKLDQKWGEKSPFLKYERSDENGTVREFLDQEELGGLMIATMLTQGVVPVTSVEEGLHMGVFEFISATGYYLFDNPEEFKQNCVKYLGMDEEDERIANASIIPWVTKYSGAAYYLNDHAGDATLLMDASDASGSAATLNRALSLPREDRMEKMKKAYNFVQENTPADWVSIQLKQGEETARHKLILSISNDNNNDSAGSVDLAVK